MKKIHMVDVVSQYEKYAIEINKRILSVIDNMNKKQLSEENEENLNEDVKFIEKKLEFGKQVMKIYKDKNALEKFEEKKESKE